MDFYVLLFGIILIVFGIVIIIATESYVDSQIPDQYDIVNEIVYPLSEVAEDSCKNVKCIESIQRTRLALDLLGIAIIFSGAYAIWKGWSA